MPAVQSTSPEKPLAKLAPEQIIDTGPQSGIQDIEPNSQIQSVQLNSCSKVVVRDQEDAFQVDESQSQDQGANLGTKDLGQPRIPKQGDPRLESLSTYSQFYQRQMIKNFGTNRLRQVL